PRQSFPGDSRLVAACVERHAGVTAGSERHAGVSPASGRGPSSAALSRGHRSGVVVAGWGPLRRYARHGTIASMNASLKDLRGKVAVVTGGAGGIGQAIGRRFGQEGMKVVLADVLAEPLDDATRALAAEGIEAAGVVTDVTDYSSVEALAKEAVH